LVPPLSRPLLGHASLANGRYRLRVRAWDTKANAAQADSDLTIRDSDLTIRDPT
jgi:hypothetical protein